MRPKLVGAVDQPPELEVLVAHHARVGRAAGLVFLGKVIDHLALEILRLIHEIVRDVQLVRNAARVRDGLRAAAFVFGAVDAVLRPELERDADHVVALLDQQRRRRRGVHAAAHADHHAGLRLFRRIHC